MEIAILRVGGGGIVILSDEMEHALTFVVKGNGSHLAILQFELRHAFEGGQCQLSFYVGVVGIVASPYFLYDASTLCLPSVAYGDGGTVVAQLGHLKERACCNALKLGIAVEIDVRSLYAFGVCAYG